jgi:hypothetical protein
MYLSGGFIFPVPALLQRPVKLDGSRLGAIIDTAAAVPAFIGMQYDGWFAFLRIGHKYIYLAYIYTGIAPVTDIWIKNYRSVRCGNIRHSAYFFLSHFFLQKIGLYKALI